ncbi:HAD family hydrolase [Pseudonocardia pini]|uniref:HAD family hydrolase n=1 Tax=Pseudonocardia pini TaxID=2758030 RepID=UPI0015F094B9|nr:HAD-IA family hydrolase [Pseudonocardia pini]
MPALLLGSISTLADTSELQREAFNQAFAKHGLDWHWERADYARLLGSSGGRRRIADQAEATGTEVDADAVHETKSQIFQAALAHADLTPRPGVVETVEAARRAGVRVALVTTTSRANVEALLTGLGSALPRDRFDLVVDATTVDRPKPDPAAYRYALETLGEEPAACIAVEDNVGGTEAARAAGLRCVAFPNANTAGHEFPAAIERTDRLDDVALLGQLT